MIRTSNVKSGRVDLSEARYVDEAVFQKWTRRLLPKRNDVILTREAPLGEVGLLRTDESVFLGQRTMVYRADEKHLNQIFLYYSLLGPTLQSQIATLGSGSTVEHVRVPDAEKLKIPMPAIEVQKKIAAILSAYDDLIENNKRRIALIEKMAEEIYREWFVRMRFPGYENVVFEKGIPDGWEVKRLGDILE
ncbi:MAG: restriction endonuclease subunit S, partial [Bacteroidota bacterium]